MCKNLPSAPIPDWLDQITPDTIRNHQFPLKKILTNSLYYPCSRFDGDPVKHLGGHILSFVYVDFGARKELSIEKIEEGFRGYRILEKRNVKKHELTPNGWRPIRTPQLENFNIEAYLEYVRKPYCIWSVFERKKGFTKHHGPFRFSLLYLCADGAAAFDALYINNTITPKAVAVIQPGHLGDNNSGNFIEREGFFAQLILDDNPSGQPDILLYGGWWSTIIYPNWPNYECEPCWPEYSKNLFYYDRNPGRVGVWLKNDYG